MKNLKDYRIILTIWIALGMELQGILRFTLIKQPLEPKKVSCLMENLNTTHTLKRASRSLSYPF